MRVGSRPHSSVKHLEASIRKEWDNLDTTYLKNVCKVFRGHTEAVIRAEGGILNHKIT